MNLTHFTEPELAPVQLLPENVRRATLEDEVAPRLREDLAECQADEQRGLRRAKRIGTQYNRIVDQQLHRLHGIDQPDEFFRVHFKTKGKPVPQGRSQLSDYGRIARHLSDDQIEAADGLVPLATAAVIVRGARTRPRRRSRTR